MNTMQTQLRIGMRFLHSRWLDPARMPNKIPALFQVTGFRCGNVYYAPVYIYASGREELSKKREYCSIERFDTICKEFIS